MIQASEVLKEDLSTFDPYDVWTTRIGTRARTLYFRHPLVSLPLVAALTVLDVINDKMRVAYKKREYPIVRAQSALVCLTAFERSGARQYLQAAYVHLRWLQSAAIETEHGKGWGIGFGYAVSRDVYYSAATAFSTVTPYVVEALVHYRRLTGSGEFDELLRETKRFFDLDLIRLQSRTGQLCVSYSPVADRIVTNATSYFMYAQALFLAAGIKSTPNSNACAETIHASYAFLEQSQLPDGAWWYAEDQKSFIDCFHTCFVLKNVAKSNKIVPLPRANQVIAKGVSYLFDRLLDRNTGLFVRFAVKPRLNLVKYDLYDNAEVLSLLRLLGDIKAADALEAAITKHFISGSDIYSQLTYWGGRMRRNTLRWAVLPWLMAQQS